MVYLQQRIKGKRDGRCDKWVLLKILEFVFCLACAVCKRITDAETVRINLLFAKYSREWTLLRNVSWGRFGQALGDATYGGYVIITAGLLIARIFREVPQKHRILEFFLLGIGVLLFLILGILELFATDDLPKQLVDNAIILGTLSVITAGLFLLDMAGPRGKYLNQAVTYNKQTQVENDLNRRMTNGEITQIHMNQANAPMGEQMNDRQIVPPTNGVPVMFTPAIASNVMKNQTPTKMVTRSANSPDGHDEVDNVRMGMNDGRDDRDLMFQKFEKLDIDKLEKLQQQLEQWESMRKPPRVDTVQVSEYPKTMTPSISRTKIMGPYQTIETQTGDTLMKQNKKKFFNETTLPMGGRKTTNETQTTDTLTKRRVHSPMEECEVHSDNDILSSPSGRDSRMTRSDFELDRYGQSPWHRIYHEEYIVKSESKITSPEPVKKEHVSTFMLPMPTLIERPEDSPNRPETYSDPGFVQHAIKQWGSKEKFKTPRHSPTEV